MIHPNPMQGLLDTEPRNFFYMRGAARSGQCIYNVARIFYFLLFDPPKLLGNEMSVVGPTYAHEDSHLAVYGPQVGSDSPSLPRQLIKVVSFSYLIIFYFLIRTCGPMDFYQTTFLSTFLWAGFTASEADLLHI